MHDIQNDGFRNLLFLKNLKSRVDEIWAFRNEMSLNKFVVVLTAFLGEGKMPVNLLVLLTVKIEDCKHLCWLAYIT